MKVAVHNIINNIEQDELDAGRLQEVYETVSYTHLTLPTNGCV